MTNHSLKTLYQSATVGLPKQADLRLSGAELLALVNGETLGNRHPQALHGLAESSSQSAALALVSASRDWSEQLAAELKSARRSAWSHSLRMWWQSVGMPPILASAGIALMAIMGLRLTSTETNASSDQPQIVVAPIEATLFNGEFEPSDPLFAASLEANEIPDQVFGGNFDS